VSAALTLAFRACCTLARHKFLIALRRDIERKKVFMSSYTQQPTALSFGMRVTFVAAYQARVAQLLCRTNRPFLDEKDEDKHCVQLVNRPGAPIRNGRVGGRRVAFQHFFDLPPPNRACNFHCTRLSSSALFVNLTFCRVIGFPACRSM
jgi:hypothetical protein